MRALISLILFIPFITTAEAQTELSLGECIRLALTHHPSVQSAHSSLQADRNAREAIGKTAYPSVHLEGAMIDAPVSGTIGYDPAISNEGELAAQAVVQEQLYDGGVRSASGRKLDINVGISELELLHTRNTITYDVTIAYISLLKSRAQESLNRERVKELGNYLALVERKWNSGSTPYTDVLKTRVSQEEARAEIGKAQQEAASSLHALSGLTGVPLDTATRFAGDLDRLTGVTAESLSLPPPDAHWENYDLMIDSLSVQSSRIDVDIARSELHPKISLIGDIGYLSSLENLKLPSEQRSPVFGYSVGVTVDQLLFDWGGAGLRVDEQQLRSDAASARHESLRLAISEQVSTARTDLAYARERLGMIRKNLADAQNGYLLVKAQYAGGGTTSLDVLSAEQSYSDVRLSEIDALADVQQAYARFQQLTAQ